jgi:Tol biopolymer transport system component
VDTIDAKPGTATRREIVAADSDAAYSLTPGAKQGYLLFVRNRTLLAQPFDDAQAKTTGDPIPIANPVGYSGNLSPFSVSATSTLVYGTGGDGSQLTWYDRTGKMTGTVGKPAVTGAVRLSPDGTKVATDPKEADDRQDILVYDLAQGTSLRLTDGPGTSSEPVWSPDGERIAFHAHRDGNANSYVKAANGQGREEQLHKDRRHISVDDWSRDGRYVIESVANPSETNPKGTKADIWILPLFGDRTPFAFVNGDPEERNARISANGRWLAYVSDETKRNEIFVQSFPEHSGQWQISKGGGDFPVWSRDGRELYFIAPDRKMMAVEVNGEGKSVQASEPKALFEVSAPAPFDVSKDGRFLLQVPLSQGESTVPLTVVTNWQAGLKK